MIHFLLQKSGYSVHAVVRRNSKNLRILHYFQKQAQGLTLHVGDVTDASFISTLIREIKPTQIYNFAAQSQVQHSFAMPSHTMDVNLYGLLNILQTLVDFREVKVLQPCTSEMFGQGTPDSGTNSFDESSQFAPVSPYGVSKVASFHLGQQFRTAYGIPVWNAITFNHESSLRTPDFVTRKITTGACRLKDDPLAKPLLLGNLDAERDWGSASDYVQAYWKMLNTEGKAPTDYVIATGVSRSVRDFLLLAFKTAGFSDLQLVGQGKDEKLVQKSTKRVLVQIDPSLYRTSEVPYL
jgi:GDPmannose 4,6-dehydratase